MMLTLLCNKDGKREDLCKGCKEKLASGALTETDIKLSRVLTKISTKYFFADVRLNGVVDLGNTLLLVCGGNIGSLIGKNGQIINEITKELGGKKRLKIISDKGDEKEKIKEITGNARIVGMSKVFKPDATEYKILIPKAEIKKLRFPLKKAQEAVTKLLSANVQISVV